MISTYHILQAVARQTSPKLKADILKRMDSPKLREILRLAYDPSITFGVRMEYKAGYWSIGDRITPGMGVVDWEYLAPVLDQLAARTLTGDAARYELHTKFEDTLEECQFILGGILNKDFKIGLGPAIINKAFPGLVPVFRCMLAEKDRSRIVYPAFAEIKYDGDRCLNIIENGRVTQLTRNGKVIEGNHNLRETLLYHFPDNHVIDGELMKGRFGQELTEAPLMAYDIIPLQAFKDGVCKVPFSLRRKLLEQLSSNAINSDWIDISSGRMVETEEDLMSFYTEVTGRGGEGLMVKDPNGLYDFKRSHGWIKVKPTLTADCPVIDFFEGTGKYEGMLGGIIIRQPNGKTCRVGSGFDDTQRRLLFDQPNLIGRTAEIAYTDVTPYGVFLFPRFRKLRDDK